MSGGGFVHKQKEDVLVSHFVTMKVGGQLFGIDVMNVQDVLPPQPINKIPLSVPHVAGALNLRGRTVTVIEMRTILNMKPREKDDPLMHVVITSRDDKYSLIFDDAMGDVLSIPHPIQFTPLESEWGHLSDGIIKLDDELLVILNTEKIIHYGWQEPLKS